jgi:hypothetical protein
MQRMLPLVIPILAIIVVGSLLVYFDIRTGGVTSLEGGSKIGYVPAVLTWVAFIASIVAMAGFCIYAASIAGPPVIRSGLRRKNILFGALVIIVLFFVLQFGIGVFNPLESGIASGEAPLALTWIAAILTLLANLGFVIFFARSGSQARLIPPARAQSQSLEDEGLTKQAKQIDVVLGDPQDAALLAEDFVQTKKGGYDRDAIQTRNNIAEWIVATISSDGRMPKKELEQRFSEQFPRVLWPLFNSVVYDLVYQNRLIFVQEGGMEVIALKAQ